MAKLGRNDREAIRDITTRTEMPFLGAQVHASSLHLDEDPSNLHYHLDDSQAARETGIGAGMHIAYERHLSRKAPQTYV